MSVKAKPLCPEAGGQAKNFNGIDLFKFICAVLVMMIHIVPFYSKSFSSADTVNYALQQGICRIAVPFYFTASGFFLFRKMSFDDIRTDTVKKYFFRLFQLYGLWTFLLIVGHVYHLWYLTATAVAIVVINICFKSLKMKVKNVVILSIILYIVGLIGGTYDFIIEPLRSFAPFDYLMTAYEYVFDDTRNGLFFGFAFVLMGALFARYEIKLSQKKAFLGLAVSLILLLAEAFMVRRYLDKVSNDMYLMLLPCGFFLFSFAVNLNLKDRPVYQRLRTMGVLMYFTHMIIFHFVEYLIRFIKSRTGVSLTDYLFISVFVVTLLTALLLEWLSRKEKFKWIKYLT